MSAPDAACLLMSLRGSLLRTASCRLGKHVQGLSVAAKELAKESKISNKLRKQLTNIDATVSYLRHITQALCTAMIRDLEALPEDGDGCVGTKTYVATDEKREDEVKEAERDYSKVKAKGPYQSKPTRRSVATADLSAAVVPMDEPAEPATKKARVVEFSEPVAEYVMQNTVIMNETSSAPIEKVEKVEVPPIDECMKLHSANAIEVCPEIPPDLLFESDDWVIAHNRLASVIRTRYGQYAGEIRVARPDEDPRIWTSGRWCPAAVVRALRFPCRFQVDAPFMSADDPAVDILRGMAGCLVGFDKDGDAVVRLDGDSKLRYVFLSDARHLLME